MPRTEPGLDELAGRLGMRPEDLTQLAVDLFATWATGQERYPTLSQQSQTWYRAILDKAGKVNPTREELKAWFGMPHGTAQYLAGVFYDSTADEMDELMLDQLVKAIVSAIRQKRQAGKTLGPEEVTVWLTSRSGRALEIQVVSALADAPMEPPTITKLNGVYKVTFRKNSGFEVLCTALGTTGAKDMRAAAGFDETSSE